MLLTRDLDTALDDLGERTVIIEAVFLFLATVSLCLRLWGRKISQRSLCLNDYFVMIAWVSSQSRSQLDSLMIYFDGQY